MAAILQPRRQDGGAVERTPAGIQLAIPAGSGRAYRLAQLDDYGGKPRGRFPWKAPLTLRIRARASAADLPGTWGFGLWNDPFTASFGLGGMTARLPALPNAAWFFYAGKPNYLAFRDDHPAQGLLAATFTAPRIPSLLLTPAAIMLPLLAFSPAARLLRRAARLLIGESGVLLASDPTDWHEYALEWQADSVSFHVDGATILTTAISPRPPLGLVIWIDNQYAAFPPSGKVQMGASPNLQPCWIECAEITINGAAAQIGHLSA